MPTSADISRMLANVRRHKQAVIQAALKAVDVFGEMVIGNAQEKTPVDTGFLQGSGTTEPAKMDGKTITKTIGFNASYAAAVHERLDVHHDVGQAKYLSSAMQELTPKFTPFVGEKVDAVK